MADAKVVCGHFRTHWTVVYDQDGMWSNEYCDECGERVKSLPGRAVADVMSDRRRR